MIKLINRVTFQSHKQKFHSRLRIQNSGKQVKYKLLQNSKDLWIQCLQSFSESYWHFIVENKKLTEEVEQYLQEYPSLKDCIDHRDRKSKENKHRYFLTQCDGQKMYLMVCQSG